VHYDALGYPKLGVLVSDFVTPRYYGFPMPPGTNDPRFAFTTPLSGPCPALPTGGALTIVNPDDAGRSCFKSSTNRLPDRDQERVAAPALSNGTHQLAEQYEVAELPREYTARAARATRSASIKSNGGCYALSLRRKAMS
jgi:hypothetical protein